MKSFGALKAWRYWSDTDPSLHHAMYQFADKAALERAIDGPEMKRLVADFNRDWPDVTRTREMLVLAEEFGAARVIAGGLRRQRTRCRNRTVSIDAAIWILHRTKQNTCGSSQS